MSESFPTLSVPPSLPMVEEMEDITIRSPFEAGYEHTRPRFTRYRKTWSIKYEYLPNSDKSTLNTFIATVRQGADSFSWTNPQDNQQYTVRFATLPRYELVLSAGGGYWNLEFTLKQV